MPNWRYARESDGRDPLIDRHEACGIISRVCWAQFALRVALRRIKMGIYGCETSTRLRLALGRAAERIECWLCEIDIMESLYLRHTTYSLWRTPRLDI